MSEPHAPTTDDADELPPLAPAAPPPSLLTRVLLNGALPALLLVFAVACAGLMIASKPTSTREAPAAVELEVDVRPLVAAARNATVNGSGLVTGAQQVRLTPQVGGRVVQVSPKLQSGGRVRQGELLLAIDPRDYRANVAQQEQALARAQLELQLERSRAAAAAREWQTLGDPSQSDASLAKREPQVVAAERAVEAAEAGLVAAKASLERTRITAPFNALVVDETVDIGQVVQPGTQLGTLVGTDAFWVQVSLPLEKVDGVRFAGEDGPGSPAVVTQRLGNGRVVERTGHVRQLMGQLDAQTRTAQLIVELPDPLDVDGLPLLPGSYVDVAIDGAPLANTWEVPRVALQDGQHLWVVDRESALRRRDVTIGWRGRDQVILTDGIQPGDQLLASPVPLPIEGQVVRVRAGREEG